MINITESAINQLKQLLTENGVMGMRIFVSGGGCSGMKYNFDYVNELAEDDTIIEQDGVKVIIDPLSSQYLAGITLDYITEISGSYFSIKNPGEHSRCGCGQSFSA